MIWSVAMAKKQKNETLMDKIVSLSKRRGFVYPGSEIYGGLANTWDFEPLGAELLKNINLAWLKKFVTERVDRLLQNADFPNYCVLQKNNCNVYKVKAFL